MTESAMRKHLLGSGSQESKFFQHPLFPRNER